MTGKSAYATLLWFSHVIGSIDKLYYLWQAGKCAYHYIAVILNVIGSIDMLYYLWYAGKVFVTTNLLWLPLNYCGFHIIGFIDKVYYLW